MKRFTLRCEHGDYLTGSIVDVAALADAADPKLTGACRELAEHVVAAHGDPGDRWAFTAVEVQEADGDLWATDVVGELP